MFGIGFFELLILGVIGVGGLIGLGTLIFLITRKK